MSGQSAGRWLAPVGKLGVVSCERLDLLIGQRLGQGIHVRIGALAVTIIPELLGRICNLLTGQIRPQWIGADARRSMAARAQGFGCLLGLDVC